MEKRKRANRSAVVLHSDCHTTLGRGGIFLSDMSLEVGRPDALRMQWVEENPGAAFMDLTGCLGSCA